MCGTLIMDYPLYYYVCRVCGHEVIASFRKQVFHHYNRSDSDWCRHDCHMDLQIAVTRLPALEWVRSNRLEEGLITRFVKV